MFSRTTMASSMSRPTESVSAISVIMLMVNPNRFMKKKVPMSAMGNVSPVMTVERHEFRNRNTISTVSSAPSMSVRRTLSTDTRMGRDPSVICSSRMPGGTSALSASTAAFSPSVTAMVFSSCAFCTCSSSVRWPLYSARLSTSSVLSLTRATCDKYTGDPPRRATMMDSKSFGFLRRASTCTTRSRSALLSVPTGRSWFSLRTAVVICSAVMPSASMALGSRSMLTARCVPPTSVTEPTPRTFSSRFFRVCSAHVVTATAEGAWPFTASGITASDQMERAAGSKRSTRGSFTSVRSVGRRIAIFSRTSSAALRPSTVS